MNEWRVIISSFIFRQSGTMLKPVGNSCTEKITKRATKQPQKNNRKKNKTNDQKEKSAVLLCKMISTKLSREEYEIYSSCINTGNLNCDILEKERESVVQRGRDITL